MMMTVGIFFWLLLLLGVVSVVMFFERWSELRRAQIDCQDFVRGIVNILDTGNEDEALSVCEETSVPVANVVAAAIRNRHAGLSPLSEAVNAQGRAEAGRLDRRLAALSIIGQISPLLGLLGTIYGFIRVVLAANAEAVVCRADLFGPWMDSLVSAAMGIAVLIAVTIMYGALRTRLERIVLDMEAAASRIVSYLSTEDAAK